MTDLHPIVAHWERVLRNRKLTTAMLPKLFEYVDEFGEDAVEYAIDEAAYQDARSPIQYIETVLATNNELVGKHTAFKELE